MGVQAMSRPTVVHSISDGERFSAETTLVAVTCSVCGILYAIPSRLDRSARAHPGDRPNGWHLSCPLGHTWHYAGETETERLRRQLESAKDARAFERSRREQAEAHARAMRGVATRRKNELDRAKARVAAGVCPCCNRTFQNLARHMNTKHPGYAKDGRP